MEKSAKTFSESQVLFTQLMHCCQKICTSGNLLILNISLPSRHPGGRGLEQNARRSVATIMVALCSSFVPECLSVTGTRAHRPRPLVPPCFCAPSSLAALPAADIEDSLCPSGNSCDGNRHGTLRSAGTCSTGRGR